MAEREATRITDSCTLLFEEGDYRYYETHYDGSPFLDYWFDENPIEPLESFHHNRMGQFVRTYLHGIVSSLNPKTAETTPEDISVKGKSILEEINELSSHELTDSSVTNMEILAARRAVTGYPKAAEVLLEISRESRAQTYEDYGILAMAHLRRAGYSDAFPCSPRDGWQSGPTPLRTVHREIEPNTFTSGPPEEVDIKGARDHLYSGLTLLAKAIALQMQSPQ